MRIWWYIASQYFKSIIGILLFSLTLFYVLTYMEESQHYFDSYKVSSKTLFLYYFWQFPFLTIQLLPFAVLIAGVVTNWMLAKHGEIAALRAAGMSMMRIAFPLICVGLLFSASHFMLNEFVLPKSSTAFNQIKKVDIEGKKPVNLFSESTWLKSQNSILHFKEYHEKTRELIGIEFFKNSLENNKLLKLIHAKSAYFDENIGVWVLKSAIVYDFGTLSNNLKTEIKPIYVTNIDFSPPKVLLQTSDSSQLSYWELKRLIEDAKIAGTNISDRLVDLYFKISSPFASLLFVFLTLPFALKKERQEDRYIGIVICLATALCYWFGNLALRSFAIKGSIHPIVAAWFMNIVVAVLIYFLIRKLDKGQ